MADASGRQQREFDFDRGGQLRILRDCELSDGKSADGKVVKAGLQKAVLRAIDDHGRYCTASYATLAKEANISRRHCVRAIDLMVSRSQLVRESWRNCNGYKQLRIVVVWNELLLLCSDEVARRVQQPSAPGAPPSAPEPKRSAPGARPDAPGGTLSDQQPTNMKRRLKRPDDGTGRDGAREFSEDEIASVRLKANTINIWIAATKPSDRELVLKIATLWHDGELPEDAVEQVLESFQRKREARARIDRPCGWLWAALRNQLRKHDTSLNQLLALTDFPRQLLALPRQQETCET